MPGDIDLKKLISFWIWLSVIIRNILILEKDIKDLTDDNIKLKQEIRRLQEVASSSSDAPSRSINNVDLLKRISQLEKVVYGNNE